MIISWFNPFWVSRKIWSEVTKIMSFDKKSILLFSLFIILFENFDRLNTFATKQFVPSQEHHFMANFVFKWVCSLKKTIEWLQKQKDFFKHVTSFKSYDYLLNSLKITYFDQFSVVFRWFTNFRICDYFNPRLTKGAVSSAPPQVFFSWHSKTLYIYAKWFLIAACASFAVISMQKRGV